MTVTVLLVRKKTVGQERKMEENKLKEIFGKLDKNHDGKITAEELEEGMKVMKVPYGHAAKLLAGIDTNHDGTVNYEVTADL